MSADIRPARVSDIDALVSIENAVFDAERVSPRSFRRHLGSDTAALLVAACGDTVLGYALVLYRSTDRSARLYSIAVAPERAGAGIGRRLLSAAEAVARAKGCPALRLEVREDNVRAIALYERAGYRCIGRRAGYYGDGTAALRLKKELAEGKRA